jgi:hypothetical protein
MTLCQHARTPFGWRPVHVSEMKYLDLHGERVAYREAGSGEALLLIHGMAGSSGPGGRSCRSCRRNTGWWHRTCSGTVNPPSRAVTIRWVRSRYGCVICSMNSASPGRRSSVNP